MINPKLQDYIFSLDDIRIQNIEYADIFNELFLSGPVTDSKEHLLSHLGDIFLFSDDTKENEEMIKREILPLLHQENVSDYLNNPYASLLKDLKVKEKQYEITYEKIQKFQLFPLDDVKITKLNKEINKIGYFLNDFHYLALKEKDDIWMSLNPNEINTMKKPIEEAKGNVLVLGLGLGYYPFMISNKKEVKEITIIELDQNIINIFNKHLLPLFSHKEKIKIIKEDGIKYLKENDLHKYDSIFIDIWHDVNDGLEIFYQLKLIEKQKNAHFIYWLYQGFIAMLKRCMVQVLVDLILNEKYENNGEFADKIIEIYTKQLSKMNISTKKDIDNLLKEDSLLAMLS